MEANGTITETSHADEELSSDTEGETNLENKIESLRKKVIEHLEKQGFIVDEDGKLSLPEGSDKEVLKNLHRMAVESRIEKYKRRLKNKEKDLINFIANGDEINPRKISPRLELIDSYHKLWNLFTYIKLHWSIPVSSGYGRRLTYIVFDDYNDKVIGILGLGDPVFSLTPRDKYIGWDKEAKRKNLKMVMDGFVIGAIPPYSFILGGKLVASLLFTNKVREDFKMKYANKVSYISGTKHTGDLVMLTTLSAFGKSSMYDRIKLPNGQRYISVGYSKGWGEFHINGELYSELLKLVKEYEGKMDWHSRKNEKWGTGIRSKQEVLSKAMRILGLPQGILRHQVSREVFLIPLARNYIRVLNRNVKPRYYKTSVSYVTRFMLKRWIIPRSQRRPEYKKWERESYLLYAKN